MKKLFRIVFATIFAFISIFAYGTKACYAEPSLSAYAYALYCVNTGDFLLSGNGEQELPMASTTKIMTAILGIEALQSSNEEMVVTMSPEMYAEGSSMYLADGEQILMSDLVGGMLMVSGNDAANAIALTVGGSFKGFGELMNAKAKEIGLNHTSFVTPSGLDAEGHYTTAQDLSKLMAYCMENTLFREIDSSSSITVDFINPKGKSQTYYNENRLVSEYEYCVAGKTGYTDKAGRTLVSCAEKDGIRLIAVTLNAPDDWNDHKKMYDYGFDCLSLKQLDINFEDLTVPVVGGTSESLPLCVGEQPSVCVNGEKTAQVTTEYELPKFIYAPVAKGDTVGTVKYYSNGIMLGQSEITAGSTVAYKEKTPTFIDNVVCFFKRIFG